MSDKYIVNNRRQKDFLYLLGFEYETKPDRKDQTKEIWLFDRTENLLEAIDFYCKFRYKNVSNKNL